jgi:probable rRNA maturation factor
MADAGHTTADADGPPLILVDDRQDEPVDADALVAVASECLIGEGIPNAELSISFVTDDEMTGLHERYLDEQGPTDVLSFPLGDDDPETGRHVLGDVVIAPAVAARNNPNDRDAELRLLLVHGILHLLGHDHVNDADHAEMWARQERYT